MSRASVPSVILTALLVATPGVAVAAGGGEGTDTMTLVWQGVNLILLLGLIVYFAGKPIQAFFKDRHAQVKDDLDSAARVLSESEARLAEWKAKAERLDAEAEEIKTRARERASQEAERILADAQRSAERIRGDAAAAVDQEVARARAALRAEAADLATELAADLLKQNFSETDQRQLVDEFVSRIESGATRRAGEA